jgi:translocation and assembly module TamB
MGTYGEAPEMAGRKRTVRFKGRRKWIRILAWVAGSAAIIVLTAVLVIVALLNTNSFHRYLLGLAQRKTSDALGVRIQLENFNLHLSALSVDLYGIRVAGADPYSNPPLLQADHLGVGIRIVSIFRRKWYLDQLQIDHPVAWVIVDKRGVSNIPGMKRSGSNNTDIFQIGIRHAALNHGEIYYNDRPNAVAADLHDLEFHSSFNSLQTMYRGTLAYTDGRLEYGPFRPLEHNFDAEFEATPSAFQLTHAKMSSGNSQAIVSAVLKNYSNPVIEAKYDIVADGRQMARLVNEPSMPAGLVRTTGSLQYQQTASRSMIQMLAVSGDLTSSQLEFRTTSAHAQLRNLAAHYSLLHGDATLRDLRANVFGGELTAQGVTQAIGGNSRSNYRADLHQISLAEMRSAFGRSFSENEIALTGKANASASAAWGKTIDDLVAHADATLNGTAQRSRTPGEQTVVAGGNDSRGGNENAATIPIDGVFHTTYKNYGHELTLNSSYLRTSQTNVDLNGEISKNSRLSVRLQANDLNEVSTIVDLFRVSGASQLELAGSASFQGTVQGSTDAPHLTGQLIAANLHFNGTDWKTLRTGIDLSPDRVALQNVDLESAGIGHITGGASTDLQKWSFSRQSPIQVELNVSRMNVATITKLSGEQLPVSGTLNARISVHGDIMNPQGNGNVTLVGATAYDQPISSASVDFTSSGNQAQATLRAQLPAGTIESRVTVEPRQRTFTAQLNSSGIDLEKLQALQVPNIDAKGKLAIHAQGQGSFDDPQLNGDLQIPALTINGRNFSGTKLQMNLANHVAYADLNSSFAGTAFHSKAQVNMAGDYLADATFDTQTIPLQSLLAVYAPEQAVNVNGQTEIHATLHGPLKKMSELDAHVTIPVLKLGYSNSIQLAAATPILVDYKDSVISVQPATIKGTDTDLELQGSIPMHSGAPMSLKVQGTVNLQLAQLFEPDLRSSGQLNLNIDSHGAIGSGELGGEIDIVDANLASNAAPVGLQHGNGVLKLTTDRLEISKFDGTIGGGPISAQGAIVYRPKIRFDMVATAKDVRMLYPQGVRESVTANLRLTGSATNAVLGGSVNLTDLSFTPAFDLDTIFDQFSGGVSSPLGTGFEQDVRFDIAVTSTSNLNLVSRTLSVAGSANLHVGGSAAEPVILGRINLSGGDVILHGSRFVLTGGTVQFINPSMTEPVLNVALTTTIQQYKIDLRFNGPSDQLRTQYTSDPALPSADIINLLAFGQTTEASAANATPANQQAESLVASQVSSQATSRISKAAGISQLSISPVLAGGTAAGPPGANLTIQQRVTGNLFVTFSTNVATTQGQTIQGQYQISPRVAVSATRDPNGGFAIDTLIKKSW